MSDLSATMGLDIGAFTRSIDQAVSRLDNMSAQASSAMNSISRSADPVTAAIGKQSQEIEKTHRTWTQFANGGIKDARSGLQDFGDASRSTGKSLAWAGFASTTLARLGVIGGSAGVVAKTLGMIMRTTGKEMKTYGFYAQVLGKDYEGSAKSTAVLTEAHEKAKKSTKGLGESTLSLAGNLSASAILGTLAWRAGLDEMVEASGKWLKSDSEMMKAVTGTASVLSEAVQNGFNMFAEGVEGSVLAIFQFTTGFDSITEMVDAGGSALTEWAQYAEESMIEFGKSVKEAGLIFGAALAIFQSGGSFDAGAYIEEGRKLNEMAEQTAATMANQKALGSVLKANLDAFGKAASDAATKNELARIATIQSVEAIDQELQALQLAANATDKLTLANKNWRKEQEAKAAALGKRKEDLTSGNAKPESIDKAIEAAQKKLDQLTMGEDEFAIATERANNASQEKIDKLMSVQEQIKATTEAKEADKKVEDARTKAAEQLSELKDKYDEITGAATKAEIAARKMTKDGVSSLTAGAIKTMTEEIAAIGEKEKAEQKAADTHKKFADQIAGLNDKVDEESGKATKGQIAERNALKGGATKEQAAEIGKLTDAQAEEEKDKKGSSGGSSENQAVVAGTAEAAKLAFGGSSKLESLAEKQIGATEKVVQAVGNLKLETPPGKDIDP